MAILNTTDILRSGGALSGLQRQNNVAQGIQQRQMNAEGLKQLKQQSVDNELLKQQEAQKAAQQEKLQQEALVAFQNNDTNKLAELSILNPDLSKRILSARGIVDDAGKQRLSDRFSSVAVSTNPREALAREIAIGKEQGLDMSDSEQILNSDLTDEQIKAQALTSLASIDGQRYKNLSSSMGVGGGSQSSPASIREFEYVKNLNPEDRELYFKSQGRDMLTPEQEYSNEVKKGELKLNQEQTKEERKLGVKDLRDIADRSRNATSQLSTLNRIEKLNEKAISGSLADSRLSLLKLGKSLGLEVEGVSESEMLRAISNDLVLSKSQQMSGALSNADMSFLSNTAPQLSQTVDGRAKIIGYGRALAEREKEYSKAAQRFRKENGYFNLSEFNNEFDAENKPLFSGDDEGESTDKTDKTTNKFTTSGGITFTVSEG